MAVASKREGAAAVAATGGEVDLVAWLDELARAEPETYRAIRALDWQIAPGIARRIFGDTDKTS